VLLISCMGTLNTDAATEKGRMVGARAATAVAMTAVAMTAEATPVVATAGKLHWVWVAVVAAADLAVRAAAEMAQVETAKARALWAEAVAAAHPLSLPLRMNLQ
jgi:hypothetical protein